MIYFGRLTPKIKVAMGIDGRCDLQFIENHDRIHNEL